MKIKQMRISEATLRAYLDKALPDDELDRIEQHLAHSSTARASLARLRQNMAETGKALSLLTPADLHHSSAPHALQRLQAKLAGEPTINLNWIERMSIMFNKSFLKRHQSAITALALLLVLIIAFSFAPVRAMAGDLLKIFRVQEVKVISVDADHLENLENNPELSGLMEEFASKTETVVDGGEPQEVASLSEAADFVDFTIAEVTNVPSDAGALSKIAVLERSVHELHLDPDLTEAIFEAAGIEIDLPEALKETPITVTRPSMVLQGWGSEDEEHLGFAQLRSPEIEYPEDLNLDELGIATLRFLGLSEAEAIALGDTIDWANTLILPIPSDADVTITEVSINGSPGTLFQEEDGADSAVMWQKDGMTYMLTGHYAPDQLLAIAQSVH